MNIYLSCYNNFQHLLMRVAFNSFNQKGLNLFFILNILSLGILEINN